MAKRPMLSAQVGLPPKFFMYTLDQIATLLEVDLQYLRTSLIFYYGRSVGKHDPDKLYAINIEPDDDRPQRWRVNEQELVRWLQRKGLQYHERGWYSAP